MVSRYVPLFDARLAIGAFVLRVCGQSGYFCPAIFWILLLFLEGLLVEAIDCGFVY